MGRRGGGQDSGEAEGGIDWVGDVYGQELEGEQVRENIGSTSTEKASQEYYSFDSAAAATVVTRLTETSGSAGAEEDTAADDPARERHKAAERERRKSMRELFLSLHALLPHGHSVRKEQSAILDEVIGYIPLAASRLRTLRGNYSHHRSMRTAGAPPTSICGTNSGSWKRNNRQQYRQHPYASSVSSSSSSSTTTYGRSRCDLIYSGSRSSTPPLLFEKPDHPVIDDARRIGDPDGAASSIISSSYVSAPVPNQQPQQDEVPNYLSAISTTTSDSLPSVSIRVRGDRVSVSVVDTREPYTSSSSCSSHGLLMLSTVLDELEAHHLRLLRSTHCRDGTKLLHYSESKIPEEMEGTPTGLKAKLQHLSHKLQLIRNASNA